MKDEAPVLGQDGHVLRRDDYDK